MTKSLRHKKFRKQEVKKIKFKIGKQLKKAQNETKTDFKTQKIILREQLSVKAASSLVTKKHLNLTELLSRLSHHGVYVRQDGLNGLKELVLKNNKEELCPHLSALFRGLNPCLLDTDHLVRTTAVRVVEALIMKNGTMIKPYFSSLTAHLSCAMVHMNTGVQSDSLALMDALLCYAPSLIAQKANAILDNFFRLISRKIDHQQKSSASTDSYALISNPSSRLASIKWRIKLLRSLSKYLEAILGEKSKIEASVPVSSWQMVIFGCMPLTEGAVGSRNSVHRTKILTEEEEAKSFILNLLPLLFQTLSEVGYNSENQTEASGTPLEPITVELLRCISEIVLHLWNITELVTGKNPNQCGWMMMALHQHVTKELFVGFPYCVLESRSSKPSQGKEKINIDVECHQLNINLASLSLLYLKPHRDMERTIFTYYIKLLSTGNVTSRLKLDKMVSTVCTLLKKEKKNQDLSGSLLEASLQCYQNLPSSDKSRSTLLKLPLQASEYTCRHLWESAALEKWMFAVVDSSLENDTVDDPLMEVLLQFRLRNTPGFSSILAQKKDLLRDKMKLRMASRCEVSQESGTS